MMGDGTNSATDTVLVTGGRIFDGDDLLAAEKDSILVSGGRITAVGRRADLDTGADPQVIDLGDCTLLPGLIDAHVHFFGVDTSRIERLFTEPDSYRSLRAARDAKAMLDAGFTAVRCLGSTIGPSIARAIREGVIDGPLVVAAGQFVAPSAGTWDDLSVPFELVERTDMFADGVDAGKAIVRRRVRQGAGVIKIGTSVGTVTDHFRAWGDLPHRQITPYTLEEVKSITQEAHRFGLKVSAHSIGEDAVRTAVLGGVDIIEHGHGISDDTRRLMTDRGTVLIPTLTHLVLMQRNGPGAGLSPDVVAVAGRHLDQQVEDLGKAIAAGIPIACGSDLIGPPWAPFGQNATEIRLLAEYGMEPVQALRAATSVGASVLGVDDERGRLRAGMAADIVAVRGNPLTHIAAVQKVSFVMQDGVTKRHD